MRIVGTPMARAEVDDLHEAARAGRSASAAATATAVSTCLARTKTRQKKEHRANPARLKVLSAPAKPLERLNRARRTSRH